MGDEFDTKATEPADRAPTPDAHNPGPVSAVPTGSAGASARLQHAIVQAKLTVGPAGDRYEQEADRVAAAVMKDLRSQRAPGLLDDDSVDPRIQPSAIASHVARTANVAHAAAKGRPSAAIARPINRIQPKAAPASIGLAGGDVDGDTDAAIRSAAGGGRPLDGNLRQSMESSFGADFSGVRVHADSRANDLNQRIQAKAFTTGSDIFFSNGQYDPGSTGGQHLLAHELTHVVQQGAAGVARSPAPAQRADTKSEQGDIPTNVVESSAGKGRSKITLRGPDGALGSVTVKATDKNTVEATNLAVAPEHRGHGYGEQLVVAAARSGAKSGKSQVKLGSQDDGSGKLDNWYQSLGFNKTGDERHGNSRFAAGISHLHARGTQRRTIIRRAHVREADEQEGILYEYGKDYSRSDSKDPGVIEGSGLAENDATRSKAKELVEILGKDDPAPASPYMIGVMQLNTGAFWVARSNVGLPKVFQMAVKKVGGSLTDIPISETKGFHKGYDIKTQQIILGSGHKHAYGGCTLPKLLSKASQIGGWPVGLTEMWFSPNDLDRAVTVTGKDGENQHFHHGTVVPSCDRCRDFSPQQLLGLEKKKQRSGGELRRLQTSKAKAQKQRKRSIKDTITEELSDFEFNEGYEAGFVDGLNAGSHDFEHDSREGYDEIYDDRGFGDEGRAGYAEGYEDGYEDGSDR